MAGRSPLLAAVGGGALDGSEVRLYTEGVRPLAAALLFLAAPASAEEEPPDLAPLQAEFARLRAAAAFSEEELTMGVFSGEQPNASYNPDLHFVSLTMALARCAAASRAGLVVMAHEVGHAVQHRAGQKFEAPKFDAVSAAARRAKESEADEIGREVAVLAGFSAEEIARSEADWRTCANGAELKSPLYPTEATRLGDAKRHVAALAAGLSSVRDAGRLRPPQPPTVEGLPAHGSVPSSLESSVAARPVEGEREGFALRQGRIVPPPIPCP